MGEGNAALSAVSRCIFRVTVKAELEAEMQEMLKGAADVAAEVTVPMADARVFARMEEGTLTMPEEMTIVKVEKQPDSSMACGSAGIYSTEYMARLVVAMMKDNEVDVLAGPERAGFLAGLVKDANIKRKDYLPQREQYKLRALAMAVVYQSTRKAEEEAKAAAGRGARAACDGRRDGDGRWTAARGVRREHVCSGTFQFVKVVGCGLCGVYQVVWAKMLGYTDRGSSLGSG